MEWIKIKRINEVPQCIKLLVWISPKDKNIPGYSDMGMMTLEKWSLRENPHMINNVTHYINIDILNSPNNHIRTKNRNALYKSILEQKDKSIGQRINELKKLLDDNS